MCTWNVGSRKYKSVLDVAAIDTAAFATPWHQVLFTRVEKSDIK
jgi:hypothetical protein